MRHQKRKGCEAKRSNRAKAVMAAHGGTTEGGKSLAECVDDMALPTCIAEDVAAFQKATSRREVFEAKGTCSFFFFFLFFFILFFFLLVLFLR